MIDLALTVVDVLRWALLGALFAATAWLALRTLRESRWLDDERPRWPESPGLRNDRLSRSMRQWDGTYTDHPARIVGETRRPR